MSQDIRLATRRGCWKPFAVDTVKQQRKTAAELFFGLFSQRYELGSMLVTTNMPFNEWTEVFGSEWLPGVLLDRLTHHVHIMEMNGESYRLKQSRRVSAMLSSD